jgi:hypothetical protein
MPRKHKPVKKTPKDGHLLPLPLARPWYHVPLRAAADGWASLLGIFRRRKQPIAPKLPCAAARRRRKI